jgi:hypothetical protein
VPTCEELEEEAAEDPTGSTTTTTTTTILNPLVGPQCLDDEGSTEPVLVEPIAPGEAVD